MKSLNGEVILITGAAGGFGQSLVKQLVPLGARLLLADLDESVLRERTQHTLQATQTAFKPDQVLGYYAADLADPAGADRLLAAVQRDAPPIDILINNAGIAMSGHFADMPRDRWEMLLQINLLAPMRLTAGVLPGMLARRHGHIANISSTAGIVGVGFLVPYSTAKFGLRGFGEALGRDLRPQGVDVTTIFPFFARTAILDSPHYGDAPRGTLPDRVLNDPDMVMRQLIHGIQMRRERVFPGTIAKFAYFLTRFAPWALGRLA